MQRQNNKSFWVFVYVANYELNSRLVNTILETRREMGTSKFFYRFESGDELPYMAFYS